MKPFSLSVWILSLTVSLICILMYSLHFINRVEIAQTELTQNRIQSPSPPHPPTLSHASFDSASKTRGVGVSLGLFASDPLWNYKDLLDEIAQVGAKHLLIVVPLKQDSYLSSTPTLAIPSEVIRRTFQHAKRHQFKMSLMPIIQLKQRQMKFWRGKLAPQNQRLWWSNYRVELKRLARLAQAERIDRLIIGAELCSLEDQVEEWKTLIHQLRTRFKGRLSYSANWDHYTQIQFWKDLDEISITAYFPIPHLNVFEQTWMHHVNTLQHFAQKHKKPLVITEYGYPALKSALREPWNETTSALFDPDLQAQLIQRSTQFLIKVMQDQTRLYRDISIDKTSSIQSRSPSTLHLAFLWNWFGFGGDLDRGFTPRKRKAEVVLKTLFSKQ